MATDWTKVYKKYKGLWVAFLSDEKTVVGSGKTAREALKKAQANGHPTPLLVRMPENLATYVGSV